ncbi:DUF664 domain-containing protein [Streptomyces sp. H10-C2]|uniref:mycothiol transferase n=1 Tax=unclassified Streptomyces TaxID=2593676 RepID=UPI0024BABC2D|nr:MULTISPECIES: DUF664 domain-containing protein [unclassified Streptomyces]MDJ0347116.1 DUF664 domain-containing protein [Streptomyces sp. PH10-H1]MDJ0375335.1 DUF664 domain-containing protein [Streptomyces sp. H10-C2]
MAFLRAQRRSVLAIVEGLDEDGVRQVAVPSGWTPVGIIEHLGHAERFWFQQVLTGQAATPVRPPAGGGVGWPSVNSAASQGVVGDWGGS